MQQKCDAWREEVEELTPLRDEMTHLHQENTRLQQEVARASEDNVGLGRQLQEMSSARRQVGELERKAAKYDQLMDRVTELQHVRVELENELGPLRDEHTATLAENAVLQQQLQEVTGKQNMLVIVLVHVQVWIFSLPLSLPPSVRRKVQPCMKKRLTLNIWKVSRSPITHLLR